ncbi:polymorphic toxin-type HINT domain-containing protein [Propionibacterium australiense]|nr:polymorphic toxin-type HINT domain-containing protein [Propionibacterium australiense]
MFTGVGGAAGLALMSLSGALTSGGISMAQQKHENGSVDLGTLGKEMAIGAIPIPGGGAAKGAGAIGREAAETAGREVTETVGREAAEQAASRTGKQELSNIGRNAADSIGDDTARAAHNACSSGNCFVADTPVLMADGTSKPIQDVQVGDEVVAYDPDTDTACARTVTNTFVHEQVETLVVRLEDGGSVETTAGHPFWTRDRGWTPAGHLKPGDQLHTPDGTWATVTSVEATGHTRTVYNLEVDGLHTYHVRAGDTWTTVHNMCQKAGSGDHNWFPRRELPRDKNGVPVPDSNYPHTQLGTRTGRNGSYPQAREFGENGELVKDIDFTDHGRPGNHPNPHQHRWLPNETGGSPKRGGPEPLSNP